MVCKSALPILHILKTGPYYRFWYGHRINECYCKKIGINIEYNQNNWYQCKLDTQRYNADTIARDIYTTDSSNYAYF